MRLFTRANPPLDWNANEEKWNRQWVDLVASNPKAGFAWYMHNGSTAREIALPVLKAQTRDHCSFCDGFPVGSVSNDTIEHFRPKCADRFPEHAYSWTNLYYCCDQCQSKKREQWDDDLLAPDAEGYTFERYFEFDFTTGEMRPSSSADQDDKRRAQITLKLYGLDSGERRRCRLYMMRLWTNTIPERRNLDEFAYRDYLSPAGPIGADARTQP